MQILHNLIWNQSYFYIEGAPLLVCVKMYMYTGWPRKNGTGYFPQYVDAITDISVWGNFSWEKWFQVQQFWFSSFSSAHFVRQCREVKWITAHSCGKQKWNSFASSLGWKGKVWNSTLSHKICPRKQTTEPKLLILVSFSSGEVTSYTNTSYYIHILWEVCRSVFLWASLYNWVSFLFTVDAEQVKKLGSSLTAIGNEKSKAQKVSYHPLHTTLLIRC